MNYKLTLNCVTFLTIGAVATYFYGIEGLAICTLVFAIFCFLWGFITNNLSSLMSNLPKMQGSVIQYVLSCIIEILFLLMGGLGILLTK